jgi:hypothetical protein
MMPGTQEDTSIPEKIVKEKRPEVEILRLNAEPEK